MDREPRRNQSLRMAKSSELDIGFKMALCLFQSRRLANHCPQANSLPRMDAQPRETRWRRLAARLYSRPSRNYYLDLHHNYLVNQVR